jgi:hypothetical protein
MLLHHAPLDPSLLWNLHAWQLSWDGNSVWDPSGTRAGSVVNIPFPSVADARWLQFKFRSTSAVTSWARKWAKRPPSLSTAPHLP